jgi:hypothetical protein
VKYYLLLWIGWLALSAMPVHAHNGTLAVAVPISGIAVDGDLSDWPEDMERYAIALSEYGVRPRNTEDLQASFRLAYDVEQKALYLAVEVRDESIVVLDEGGTWKNQG